MSSGEKSKTIMAKALALASYCPFLSFIYNEYELPETDTMRKGREIHEKYNMVNQEVYEVEINGVVVRGKPDKIGRRYVIEFKYAPRFNPIYHEVYELQLQIYMLMTGRDGLLLYNDGVRTYKVFRYRYSEEFKNLLMIYLEHLIDEVKPIDLDILRKHRKVYKKCRYCIARDLCMKLRFNRSLGEWM